MAAWTAGVVAAALTLGIGVSTPVIAQATQGGPPAKSQVISVATGIMRAARYCTLVTIGPGGQPQARIVDPLPPESDLTIWIATNPLTRKVTEIRADRRVTLTYFTPATFEYVTVIGTAALDPDPPHKADHWKPEWAAFWDQKRGEDYLLLRVTPSRLEVSSVRAGLGGDPKTWLPVILDLP
jgi:general stress protein 26